MHFSCLRCGASARDDHEDVLACEACGATVLIDSKRPQLIRSILARASVEEKEGLLDALDAVLGEDCEEDGAVILDADTLAPDDGAWRVRVTHRSRSGTRTVELEEEPALGFLGAAVAKG